MKKEDILSRFLQIEDKDPKYIRDIILSFIIAGKDTTSTAMTWFIYVICKHPDIQEKVAKEIKEAANMRNVTNVADFANSASEQALEKMQYLHAALTETLRLFPAVPVVSRRSQICNSFSYIDLTEPWTNHDLTVKGLMHNPLTLAL